MLQSECVHTVLTEVRKVSMEKLLSPKRPQQCSQDQAVGRRACSGDISSNVEWVTIPLRQLLMATVTHSDVHLNTWGTRGANNIYFFWMQLGPHRKTNDSKLFLNGGKLCGFKSTRTDADPIRSLIAFLKTNGSLTLFDSLESFWRSICTTAFQLADWVESYNNIISLSSPVTVSLPHLLQRSSAAAENAGCCHSCPEPQFALRAK